MNLLHCYKKCRINHPSAFCLRECTNCAQPQPTTMRQLLHNATGCKYEHIHIRDAKLDPISIDSAKAFLIQDETDLQEYIKEKHDCDDFADRLYCAAREYFFKQDTNVAWANIEAPIKEGLHRLNGFVTHDSIFLVVEPQTDAIYNVHCYLTGKPNFINM